MPAIAPNQRAFEALLKPTLPKLRAYLYRMLAHPEDAEDALQETLTKAYAELPTLKDQEAFRGWIFRIATHVATDTLRGRVRWRLDAQIDGERYSKSHEQELAPIVDAMMGAGFRYDFREHIAFCFTCVSRSLPPEEQAALLLKDVFELTSPEAKRALGVSESIFRHRLAAARKQMTEAFDGLCALVSKEGVCYQCDVLREASPEDRRGPAVEPLGAPAEAREERFKRRLRVVREADLEGGGSHALHGVLLRLVDRRQRRLAS